MLEGVPRNRAGGRDRLSVAFETRRVFIASCAEGTGSVGTNSTLLCASPYLD